MILISHRGNINGKNLNIENHPSYIDKAIEAGYDVVSTDLIQRNYGKG